MVTLVTFRSIALTATLFLVAAGDAESMGQDHEKHKEHAAMEGQSQTLEAQLAELRASVARLEAALEQGHRAGAAPGAEPQKKGMGMKQGRPMGKGMGMKTGMKKGMKKGMGKMPPKPMSMDGAPAPAKPGKMAMGGSKRVQMMGRMRAQSAASSLTSISALPGFPGASHIYHIGATGFFMDHADLVQLSMAQRRDLAKIQERSVLAQVEFDRRIEKAEQELWVLTSAGQPDARAIEAKVREVATVSADQRLAFIRSVGAAAKVMTAEQRSAMVGDLAASFPDAHDAPDAPLDSDR